MQTYADNIQSGKATRLPSFSTIVLTFAIHQGNYPAIRGLSLEKEIEWAMEGENSFHKGTAHNYHAHLLHEKGESPAKIIKNITRSLELLEESGHEVEIAKQRFEMSQLLLSMGKPDDAAACLEQIRDLQSTTDLLVMPGDLKFLIGHKKASSDILSELLTLGQDLVTIRNHKELLNYTITKVNALTGAERGAIFLLKAGASGQGITLRASQNLTQDDLEQPEFAASLEIINEVIAKGKAISQEIELTEQQKRTSFNTAHSCICVPMINNKKIVGVLYHDNRYLTSAFAEKDLQTMTYFAALAAIAIDNAEAYDEIKRLNQKLSEEKQYYRQQHLESMRRGDFIGSSKPIQEVLQKINQVSETETTVLILGETGVGKELVAATILDNSLRRDKPFICVNCSAFSETLIASELFGHEKGAFTGANERRIGRFELADGGTLFLDEIGDIPLAVQVRLLRVLQTKKFERVGGTKSIHSDFRLLAATNQDLRQRVAEGQFREELYYRLNVFPILVPPLRQRAEDISLLANYFLQNFSQKTGKFFSKLSEENLKLLKAHHWPGNVRELINVIERSVIMSSDSDLQLPELRPTARPFSVDSDLLTMMEMEKRYLIRVLEKTHWKIRGPGGAAELLDMHYSTLRARIRKHGIKKKMLTVLQSEPPPNN